MQWELLVTACFLQSALAQYGPGLRDAASRQLPIYKEEHPYPKNSTTSYGTPIYNPDQVYTIGKKGPLVMSDTFFLDEIFHFDRERIPERVVHAKGAGAIGYLTITNTTIAKFCKAALFAEKGKKIPVFVRFSTTRGESGSADTLRDLMGLSMKAYTEEGNWDLLCVNSPVFWIRDPSYFISLVHASKRNPVTNLRDPNMLWDFLSLEPSTVYTTMILHSKNGIPLSYRHMNAYAINTFTLYDDKDNVVFCKFNFISNQGVKGLDPAEAERLAGAERDYYIKDMYNSLEDKGQKPSWKLTVQIMTPEQAKKANFSVLDPTKYWLPELYPLIEVGRLDLVANPPNYFAFVEQCAFSPGHLVPGMDQTDDQILQARAFAYPDAHNYRLGPNLDLIPVNKPYLKVKEANNHRDGASVVNDNQDGSPNYYPNSFNGPRSDIRGKLPPYPVSGIVDRYDTGDDDNFSQPTMYWNKLTEKERQIMVDNIVESLGCATKGIQERAVENFMKVSRYFGSAVARKLGHKPSSPYAGKK